MHVFCSFAGQVDDVISDASSFICVLDDLRPLDPASYNPFYEVWTRIARIPPEERYRLVAQPPIASTNIRLVGTPSL